jgi:hypothetical protein
MTYPLTFVGRFKASLLLSLYLATISLAWMDTDGYQLQQHWLLNIFPNLYGKNLPSSCLLQKGDTNEGGSMAHFHLQRPTALVAPGADQGDRLRHMISWEWWEFVMGSSFLGPLSGRGWELGCWFEWDSG